MARWKLMNSHYLNVPGTEWEHKETSNTGKQVRKIFAVPLLLNTNDAADFNYPGEIIVAYAGPNAHRQDIIFVGEPTPDMEPLDEEAEEISASFADKWKHPIDSLPANGDYSQSLITKFERMMAEVGKVVVPNTSASPNEIDVLRNQIAELTARLDAKPEPVVTRKV